MYRLLLKNRIMFCLIFLIIAGLITGIINCQKSSSIDTRGLTDIDLYALPSSGTGNDSFRYINEKIDVVIDVYFPEHLDSIAHYSSIDTLLVYGITKSNITELNRVTYSFARPCTAMVYARGFSGGTLITSDSIMVYTIEKPGKNRAPDSH